MQLHVVQRGDSLYKLSKFYQLPWREIAAVNHLTGQDILTVGQTLLIPTPFIYVVQPGDTVDLIAKTLGVEVNQLKENNPGLNDESFHVGQLLNIPPKTKRTITTNAFAEPSEKTRTNFHTAAKALSYITLFSYQVNENGELKPLDDSAFLQEIHRENVRPIMAITNIKDGKFSAEVGTAVLKKPAVRESLIQNCLKVMKEKQYTGISVDLEYLGKRNREPFNEFLRLFTTRMHAEGYIVTTALAPKKSADQKGDWYESHDYVAHGQTVDYCILMTYEWGFSGGPPLAVSPVPEVRKVLDYAMTSIPRSKILMGINLYGYDWKLPYVKGGPFAKAFSPVQATQLAGKKRAAIQYDHQSEAPFFSYWDKEKKQHVVWFEDLRSMKAKFDLIDEYRLGGASFWNLAFNYPVLWNYLLDRYSIKYQ